MSKLTSLRAELAEALGTATGLIGLPHLPGEPRAGQLWLKPDPNREYIDAVAPGATFRKPAVHFQAVFVSSMLPFAAGQAWVDDLICDLWSKSRLDPTLRGLCSGFLIQSWSAPGPLDVNAQLLAVEMTLSPIIVSLED